MDKKVEMAKYAYENSIFYREFVGCNEEITKNSFDKLKVISKEDIVMSNCPLLPLKYMIVSTDDETIRMTTSGSTGKMFEIEWNKSDYFASMYELWLLRYKYYGIRPDDKMCFFYSDIQNVEENSIEIKNGRGFSKVNLSDKRIVEIYKEIMNYKPVWLLLQPSIAGMIINIVKKYNLEPINTIKYIEFSGEMLDEALKNEIKEIFNCKVANQYGSYEFNSIAYECPEGNMHIMGSNVYVETDENEDIIVTSLNNYRNPLVRYNIGDKGKLLMPELKCKCGNCNRILQLKKGRSHEFVDSRDRGKINSYIFMKAIMRVNEELDNEVKQFQVIQTDIDKFDVRLFLESENRLDKVIEIFQENIEEKTLVNAEYRYILEEGYIKEQDDRKLMFFRKEKYIN